MHNIKPQTGKKTNKSSSTQTNEFAGEPILKEMSLVLKWFQEKGLIALHSRYSRYGRDIDRFFSHADPISTDGRSMFDKLTNSYIECLNIVLIHRAFRDEANKGFSRRLMKVAYGQDHPYPSSAGPSRDYLFELIIAARFSLSGYKIDFDQDTDVVAESKDFLIFGECKRLSSEGKFEANFKKAGKQIALQVDQVSRRIHGLIFIDVSTCLKNLPKTELPNVEVARRETDGLVKAFVARNSSKIMKLNERFSGSSLGVCITGQVPIWTQDATLHLVTSTQTIAPASLADDDFERLQKIMSGFSSSLLSVV